MIKLIKNKKAQEEIVGFAIIIILVAVVFVAFLGFSLNNQKQNKAKSYEIKNFLEASMEYTVSCTSDSEPLRKLIFLCKKQSFCINGVSSCEMLNQTLQGIIDSSWNVDENSSIKAYKLDIRALDSEPFLSLSKGNETRTADGEFIEYAENRNIVRIELIVYKSS